MSETNKTNLAIAKKINKLGTINLVVHIVVIVAFIIWLTVTIITFANMNPNNNMNSLTSAQIGLIVFIAIVGVIYFLCNLIFGIIVIIKIATTDWQDENLNQTKLVFWVLSLVFIMVILINPILWIIWAKKVKGNYSSKEQLPQASN